MQKTDYMVFAGRQYFLGDKCQVRNPQLSANVNLGWHPSAFEHKSCVVSGASGAKGKILQRLHSGSGNSPICCHSLHRGAGREVRLKISTLTCDGVLWCHSWPAVMSLLRHLVPLTDLKPVNPVPAWNVSAPPRKGELGRSCSSSSTAGHFYFVVLLDLCPFIFSLRLWPSSAQSSQSLL